MKKEEILKRLDEKDIAILHSIYTLRCLTFNQIFALHFEDDDKYKKPERQCSRKLNDFISYEILEKNDEGRFEIYQLTSLGVNLVRSTQKLPPNIFDIENRVVKRGYFRAYELKIQPRFVNHQIHLNQFLIDFIEMNKELGLKFRYYDEKFTSKYVNIRPDGIISTPEIDFFLEEDMSTESLKQLDEKFRNYWNFINSSEYKFKDKKIIMLFICDNTNIPQTRIDLVNLSISNNLLDKIDETFDIYVNTRENLLQIMRELLTRPNEYKDKMINVLEYRGFRVTKGELLRPLFNDYHFDIYARLIEEKSGEVLRKDGRLQEFIFDGYNNRPFYTLSKIVYLSKANIAYKEKLGREILYIICLKNERELLDLIHDLKVINGLGMSNVYYTCLSRLRDLPFNEAIFYVSATGAIQNFTDFAFSKRQFLTSIDELEEALGGIK